MVQWLSLCASYTRDMGSMPGWETKIPFSIGCGKKKKRERKKLYSYMTTKKQVHMENMNLTIFIWFFITGSVSLLR